MTSSLGSNPSLSLLDLPPQILDPIFQYVVHDKGFSALAQTSRQCKDITYAILRSQWLRLNLPDAGLPQGLVDLSSLMGRIEQLHPDDFEAKPSNLFQELADEFASLGANLRQGKLPLTPADLTVLQNQALHIELEESLFRIWKKIEDIQYQFPGTIPKLKTTAAIRSWLDNSNNAGIINGITYLNLSALNLRVLPPEILKFTQLEDLDLSGNRFSVFPDIIVNFTGLQVLDLHDNNINSIPNTIGTLTGLKGFSLSNNRLRTLPKEIGALNTLQVLHLSSNPELITLPKEFGALGLKILTLNQNGFKTIPDVIADLTGLETFEFDTPRMPFIRFSNKILSSNCPALKKIRAIKNFKEQIEHPSKHPLAKLYQSILQNETEDKIKTMFFVLSADDKNLIYEHIWGINKYIWLNSGSPQTDDPQWGEHHIFDNMDFFNQAVHNAITAKCAQLSEEKKEQVYHNICKLSVNRYSNPENWYFDLIEEENQVLLVDAMAMLETHGKDEE